MNNEDRLFAYFATLPVEGALHTPTNAYRGNVEWRGVGRSNKLTVKVKYRIRNGKIDLCFIQLRNGLTGESGFLPIHNMHPSGHPESTDKLQQFVELI